VLFSAGTSKAFDSTIDKEVAVEIKSIIVWGFI
jgi:hypothetical protein